MRKERMRSPIPDYLTEVLADFAPNTSGAPARYIPELATAARGP